MKKVVTVTMLLLLTMSIALTGCSGDKANQGIEATPKTDDNSSQKEPTGGGNVVVGIQQDMDSLDPHKAVAAGTTEVLFNVFEGLVKPDEKGNLHGAVASDYKISEDGKEYTFTLRDGIKFHNGTPVTVEDIIYSIKRSAGLLDTVDSSIVVESALQAISEVTATDDKTVVIKLKEANTELLPYLTCAIIPANYDKVDKEPMGTGPFKFVSYTPLQSFVIAKNEDYLGEKPHVDQVTFKIVSNTDAAFMELKAGTIDIYPYLTSDQAEQLSGDFTIEKGNMNLVQGLFLNNGKAPFDNQKVREALNYAIDKQAVIDMVAAGDGSIIGSNMFHGFEKYYMKELEGLYPYNVEKAKQLLQEAGVGNLSFTITVPSNYQFHVDTAQIIVEQLKQAGITAKIQLVEWADWLTNVYKGGNYEATIVGLDSNLAARDLLERYGSEAGNNFVKFKNADYDQALQAAMSAIDDEEKVKYYKECEKILAENSASVYIQDPPLLVAVNKKLAGYTFYPVYVQDMSKIYFTK